MSLRLNLILGSLIFLLLIIIPTLLMGHSGNTNSAGCHNNHKTGGYHCHNSKSSGYSSSSTSSTTNSNNNSQSKNEQEDLPISKNSPGTYETKLPWVVYKNARCDDTWNIDLVNRSDELKYNVSVVVYSVDKDGDPLISEKLPAGTYWFLRQKIRITIKTTKFDCAYDFEELNFTFEFSLN